MLRTKMRRSLGLLVLVAVPLILLLVNELLSRGFEDTRLAVQDVEHTHLTREQLKTILSVHQDIETGQRGYILTGSAAFLQPSLAAEKRLEEEFAELEVLVADDHELRSAVPPLRDLSRKKRAFSAEVVALARQGAQQDAARLVATGEGKAVMDELRRHIARMDAAVGARLFHMGRLRTQTAERTQQIALALQAILILLLAAAAWAAARSLRAERKTARRFKELSARQEAIFDAAIDGLMIHDIEGTIISVNPAVADMFGYEPAQLVGGNVRILFENPPSREKSRAFLDKIAGGHGEKAHVAEFNARRADGSGFPVDVATSSVELAGSTQFLAAIRDATDRKRVEQMKTEFVSTVSHELRTPLTSIAGSLGLLSGGAAGPLPDKATRLIDIALSNSRRLVRLINDILDIEKIESGKMSFHFTWLPLRPMLEQAVQANRSFAAEHGVELELGAIAKEAAVLADEDRLMQVLTNLISNAAKFSPEGEIVRIGVTTGGERHRITVADRGSGIPEAFRDRIFGKFAQADSSDTRTKAGTGLGLSIVREIVTRLGGSVGFESNLGKGTTFYVDLPAAQAEPAAHEQPLSGSQDLPRILHVDDDPDMLCVVASAFEGKAQVQSVPSVREGLSALRRQKYDAVILDVDMADGSGLDLLPLLRGSPPVTPTVLFTVHDTSPALAERVDAVLTKSRSTLHQLVDTLIGLARSQERKL